MGSGMNYDSADMPYQAQKNALQFAAWTHAEFVKIHPYPLQGKNDWNILRFWKNMR